MARPAIRARSFIEEARREQIVSAAIDVLYEGGFAAASLGAIAERIGVSKGVISYHFTSKSELLREVVAHVLTEASAYMGPRIAAAGSRRDALRTCVTANLDYIGANRRKIIAFTEIVNGMPPGGTEPAPYDEGRRQAVGGAAAAAGGGPGGGRVRRVLRVRGGGVAARVDRCPVHAAARGPGDGHRRVRGAAAPAVRAGGPAMTATPPAAGPALLMRAPSRG